MSSQQDPAPKIYPLGDAAIVLQFGETISRTALQQLKNLSACLAAQPIPGMIEYVPGFTTLTIFYNPWIVSEKGKYNAYEKIKDSLHQIMANSYIYEESKSKQVEIPVCYGGDFGPDLPFVAQHNHLTEQEVIATHTRPEYLVYMIGFAPGFPYLGGMDNKIAAPRKSNPRLAIPKGSVGIAGEQTGVYPIETPGGWQLIGRTPLPLFNPNVDTPAVLQAGDVVKFVSISKEAYHEQKELYNGA